MSHFQNDWQSAGGFKLRNHFPTGFGSDCVTFLGLVVDHELMFLLVH
jgi:hypothetical protein